MRYSEIHEVGSANQELVPQPAILIVGFGNPLRKDDGLGHEALRILDAKVNHDLVRLKQVHQLGPELAEEMSRASLVIFIDAAQDLPPGEVQVRPVRIDGADPSALTHDFSPDSLLSACARWYSRQPEAFVCTMGGQFFGVGESLSQPVQRAMPELLRRVRQILEAWVAQRLINADPWEPELSHA